MGYSIYIGDRKLVEADDEEEGTLRETIDRRTMDAAPSFPNDPTGKSNTRHPSYTQWSNFCRDAGLYDFFFNEENGLMRDHPGIVSLNKNHLKIIEEARIKWEKEHPDAIPGFEPDKYFPRPDDMHPPEGKKFDGILARLLWLEFWVRWAVFHLKNPAIENG